MPFIGELSALLTAALWSCSALVFTSATRNVGSFYVNITRLILAAVLLVLLGLVLGFDYRLSSSQLLNLSISGVIGLSLGDTFLFRAFKEIGARIAMLIMSLAPAVAALLAFIFLGEELSLWGIAGIALTILGVGIVVVEQNAEGARTLSLTTSGIVLAFLAAVGQGAGLVFAKLAFREGAVNGFVASTIRILASLIVLLPIAVASKRFTRPLHVFKENPKAFWLTALGSVIGPFLGISFSLIAIEHAKVGIAATIMATVPILMLPLIRFVYHERLPWKAIGGAFVAVGGVALLFIRQ